MTEDNRKMVYIYVELNRGLHDYTIASCDVTVIDVAEQDFLDRNGFESVEEYEQAPCDNQYFRDEVELLR